MIFFTDAFADEFAVVATPPRFEFKGEPGVATRQVIEITNASTSLAKYSIKTADWVLDANGGALFSDKLATDSCRSWVALEKLQISVPPSAKYRYRFEVKPPANTPARECHFAIMVSGSEQTAKTAGGLVFPFSGRLGVIVYVAIGDVKPKLDIVASEVKMIDGIAKPIISVQNTGTAHGRLAGFLSGTDAAGKKIEFSPSGLPIMVGETRKISLDIQQLESSPVPTVKYPITIRGKLEWGSKNTPFEQEFRQ
ncbi:MAG: hypothetical protein WBP13_00110 [Methylophilaceae bacterium]